MGFACRVAMAFGGIKPGDFRKILIYNKDRTFAFVMPLGFVTDEWYANAAGAINWGFPTIADTPIPEGSSHRASAPTSMSFPTFPHDQIVQKAVEVRGLKVQVASVPIPVSYGPAFEGERVRGEDIYLECGGGRTHAVEWVISKNMDEVEDGKGRGDRSRPGSAQTAGSACRWRSSRRWRAGRCRRISNRSWSGRSTT